MRDQNRSSANVAPSTTVIAWSSRLAGVDAFVTMKKGFQLKAEAAPFAIGPLALSSATSSTVGPLVDIGAGIPVLQENNPPHFPRAFSGVSISEG